MQFTTFSYDHECGWNEIPSEDMDSNRTLIIVFGGSSFVEQPEIIRDFVDKFPESKLLGCSTAGEIFGQTINEETLSGAIMKFEKTEIKTVDLPISTAEESFGVGKQIGEELYSPDLKGIFVLSDGLNVNGSTLVKGLNSALPSEVIVTGGLAGDNDKFEKTWVLKDGNPENHCVSAVGFYGSSIRIGHGSKGGWDIFGPERKVTKSENNVLFELDGKNALELYKNYLGERAAELPASALFFPLALRLGETEKQVVRTILKIDEENQSMTFAGDLPEGSMVQLMRANLDRLIDGASKASETALATKENWDKTNEMLCISISCVGRRLILGERAEEELEAVRDFLPETAKQVGFYSYGEISPHTEGFCDLHNQTMTLTTISED